MDKKYIKENEIEIKYLRNQLTDDELEEFEVYLMDHPEVVDQLKLDSVLLENVLLRQASQDKGLQQRVWGYFVGVYKKLPTAGISISIMSFICGAIIVNSGSPQLTQVQYSMAARSGQQNDEVLEYYFPNSSFTFFSKDQMLVGFDLIQAFQGEFLVSIHNGFSGKGKPYRTLSFTSRAGPYSSTFVSLPVRYFTPGDYLIQIESENAAITGKALVRVIEEELVKSNEL